MSSWNTTNQWHGIGRLARDPVVTVHNGVIRTRFTLVIYQRILHWDTNTTEHRRHFIPVSAAGSLGEAVARYLMKGSKVFVQGPLVTYLDTHNNQRLRIHAETVNFLDKVRSNEEAKQVELPIS